MMKSTLLGLVVVACGSGVVSQSVTPFPSLAAKHKEQLVSRLESYVGAYRNSSWDKLYDLTSTVARGGVKRDKFVEVFKATHRPDFSSYPDLLTFHPSLVVAENADELDIYGCAHAQREGHKYTGIALVHAAWEGNQWFFSGWSFSEFPNQPCKMLADKDWEPVSMEWNQPLGELRQYSGTPVAH